MSRLTVTKTQTLAVWETWCGHWIAVSPDRQKTLMATGEIFWCPYGHQSIFSEPENDRLRLELAKAEERANAESTKRQQTEAMLTAVQKSRKRRSEAGLCQYCRRHFVNMERHHASKHEAEHALKRGGNA